MSSDPTDDPDDDGPDPAESDPREGMDDTPAKEQENLPEPD